DRIGAAAGVERGRIEARRAQDVVRVGAAAAVEDQVRDVEVSDGGRAGPRDRRAGDRVGGIGGVGRVVDVEGIGADTEEAGEDRYGALKGSQDVERVGADAAPDRQ